MKKRRKITTGQALRFISLLTTVLSAVLLGINLNSDNHVLALLWGSVLLMNMINMTLNVKSTP